MSRRYRYAALLMGVVLYVVGASLHLKLLRFRHEPSVFGGAGDGFFNMWVMDHTVRCLVRGDLNILDGHIFWPENANTILWSDNLFVPTVAFAVFKAAAGSAVAAFRWTAMLLNAMAFAAYFLLFLLILLVVRGRSRSCPDWAVLFVPVFSYMACFSAGRLSYFSHFQNLSSFWLFTLAAGAIGHMHFGRRTFFALAAVSEVLLLYSSPYFAVLGVCFIGVWALVLAVTDLRGIPRMLRDNIIVVAVCGVIFGVLAYAYLGVPHLAYSPDDIHSISMRLHHLVVPRHGLAAGVARRLFGDLPSTQHESPAYLGAGLLIALPAAAWWVVASLRGRFGAFFRAVTRRQVMRESVSATFIFIVLCAGAAYALALGPRPGYGDGALNPSVCGLLALVVPGVRSIRAPGRLAVVGQGLLFAALIVVLFHMISVSAGKQRRCVVGVAVMLLLLQFADQLGAHGSTKRVHLGEITPTAGERAFFDKLDGPVLVFPTRPLHRNTYPMLYFINFPNVMLVNGYSARSSALFSRLMELGELHGAMSEEQLRYACEHGCRYLVVCRRRTSAGRIESLKGRGHEAIFESDHFVVFPARSAAGTGR